VNEDQARKAYEDGIVQYNLAAYDQAIDLFKRAYLLSKKAALLFNIAQAYRLKKDCENANHFYKSFIREQPKTAETEVNIRDAEELLGEMQRCLEAQGRPTATPEAPRDPQLGASKGAEVPRDEVVPPGRTLKLTGLAVGAAGAVVGSVGVYFLLQSILIAGDRDDECFDSDGCPLDRLESFDDRGRRANALAYGLGLPGAAAILAGGYLYYLGYKKDSEHRPSHVWVTPTREGGAIVWTGRF
jgi:tetratricopeptide (TPR) repeat protein